MSIWSAATTIPTISGSLGAPPACALALAGRSASPNMIGATAHKALCRFCIPVFDLLISFNILPPRCLVLPIAPPVQSDQRLPDKYTTRVILSFLCHDSGANTNLMSGNTPEGTQRAKEEHANRKGDPI